MKLHSKTIIAALALTLIIVSCDTQTETQSITGNYTYKVISEGEGPEIKNQQYMVLDLKVIDTNDSVWFDRMASENPMVILKDSAKWSSGTDGVYEIFYYSKKGDSLVVDLTVDDFFSNTVKIPTPPEAEGIESISMFWKVAEVFDYDDYVSYMMGLEAERAKQITEAEQVPIEAYIADNGWVVSAVSPGGVRVIIHEAGEGENAQPGQRIAADYSGFFLDGTLFDTSNEEVAKENNQYSEGRPYQPYSFVVAQDAVIDGWHEGFQLLNKGSKATFIIPSSLGYGERGFPPGIPGNAILRFDVELADIEQ